MSNQTTEVELPALPRGRLDRVTSLAESLEREMSSFVGSTMTSEYAHALAYRTTVALGDLVDQDIAIGYLSRTFEQYNTRTFDKALANTMAWQIAARLQELNDGLLIAYSRPVKQEWIAVEIIDVQPSIWRDDRRGCLLTFFVLSGHPAGHTLTRNFPESWLRGFAYQIGFGRRIQYDEEPRHFIGLRIWGYLQPDPESTELTFEKWEINSAFRKHNLRIIKLRTRLEHDHKDDSSETGIVECPYGHQHYCWNCPVGKASCPAACRKTSQ